MKDRKKKEGFSFVEAVITLVLISAGMLGVLQLFDQNVRSANDMEHTVRATYLAQERMEQIIQDKKYQGFDYIVMANFPASEDLSAQGFNGYTRTLNIVEVRSDDLITPAPPSGSGYKRVTVSVQVAGGDLVTLETLLTLWGEE